MALRVWLPLNGNIKNQGLGPQPVNDGTLTYDNGKIGQCRKTGGAKFTANQSTQIFNDNGFTYCAWIYVPGEAGGAIGSPNCFFGRDGAPRIYAIFQYPKVDDLHLSWTQYNDDKSSSIYKAGIQCNDFFDVKTWVHVAVTYEPGKITVYKNGVQYATTTGTPTWSTQPGGYEYETWALTNTPNAYFNDIRVYDECLSQKQIKEISKGLVAHYKLDNFNGTNLITSLQAGGHTTIHGDTVQTDGTDADTYFWLRTSTLTQGQNYTFKAVVSGMPDNIIYRWAINNDENVRKFDLKNGLNVISFTCPSLNDFTKLLIDDRSRPSGWNYPITFSKIELIDSNGGSVIDVSGNGYNGKTSGTLIYNLDSARYSGSTNFNATGYIAVGRPMPRDELTVNVWAYMDNWASYNSRLGSCTEGGGWNFEPASSAMNFAVGVGTSSCTYMNNFTSSQAPLSGISAGWHMFTGTFDGIYKRLYIDGELKGEINGLQNGTTLTTKTPIFYNGNNGVFIGAEAGGTQTTGQAPYFNGSMVDFRIYATALSANDILTMYKNSGIIDNKGNVYAYEFREE